MNTIYREGKHAAEILFSSSLRADCLKIFRMMPQEQQEEDKATCFTLISYIIQHTYIPYIHRIQYNTIEEDMQQRSGDGFKLGLPRLLNPLLKCNMHSAR